MAFLYEEAAGQLCPNVFKFPFVADMKATHDDVERCAVLLLLRDIIISLGFMCKQEPGLAGCC